MANVPSLYRCRSEAVAAHDPPRWRVKWARIVQEDRSGKPTEAVSKELGVSHRTASRWIAAARAEVERQKSLEGHRRAHELAEGSGGPTSVPGLTASTDHTPDLSPEELDEAAEEVLSTKKPRNTTPARRLRPA